MMRQFLKRMLLFGLIAFPVISFESLLAYFTKSYESRVNGQEIYVSLRKSKARKKVKILVIGDSVGKQLYDNDTYNGDVYSLTTNQAVSMAGQYILIKNFLDSNRNSLPGKILMVITPGSFRNNLAQLYTFHYFLKPFYKPENKKYLTAFCNKQIQKVPLYYTSQLPFVLNTNWSPMYNPPDEHTYGIISPISQEYLIKTRELCSQNHIEFQIVCPPIKMANQPETQQAATYSSEFKKCGLAKEFDAYFKTVRYLPDSLYQDHIHFKPKFIPDDYFRLKTM